MINIKKTEVRDSYASSRSRIERELLKVNKEKLIVMHADTNELIVVFFKEHCLSSIENYMFVPYVFAYLSHACTSGSQINACQQLKL